MTLHFAHFKLDLSEIYKNSPFFPLIIQIKSNIEIMSVITDYDIQGYVSTMREKRSTKA